MTSLREPGCALIGYDRAPTQTIFVTMSNDRSVADIRMAARSAADPVAKIVSWCALQFRVVVGRLGQRFWARGIGTAALRQFLQREQIRPLFADPFIANTASVRLLQRCGFRRVGTACIAELP